VHGVNVCAGLGSGVCQALLFHPWDRALYLSVVHKRPFLSKPNFVMPLQGLAQTFVQRTASGALYFVLQGSLAPLFSNPLILGLAAGSSSGLCLNFVAAVKYRTWSDAPVDARFARVAASMWTRGGLSVFWRGAGATVVRDAMFGAVYELTRNSLGAVLGAAVATLVSSPVNYVRSIQFGTRPNVSCPSIVDVLRDLLAEVSKTKSFSQGASLTQQRLRIGWGTARVAAGVAFGQWAFDHFKDILITQIPLKH